MIIIILSLYNLILIINYSRVQTKSRNDKRIVSSWRRSNENWIILFKATLKLISNNII